MGVGGECKRNWLGANDKSHLQYRRPRPRVRGMSYWSEGFHVVWLGFGIHRTTRFKGRITINLVKIAPSRVRLFASGSQHLRVFFAHLCNI